MQLFTKKSLALLALGLSYAYLFNEAELGINLFFFDALLVGLALWLRPELSEHRGFVWSVGGLLFAAGSVVLVNGSASRVAHQLTFFLVMGFAQARELRFIWFGILLGLHGTITGPLRWLRQQIDNRRKSREHAQARNGSSYWVLRALTTAAIVIPFLLFYAMGNAYFASGLSWLGDLINNIQISGNLIWSGFLTVVGLWLCAGLFFPFAGPSRLVNWQNSFLDVLLRRPEGQPTTTPRFGRVINTPRPRGMLALRTEYRQAILTFGTLNALLAIVNLTDLRYVWMSAGELSAATLSHYVHVGTYNLTFSIFLAMLVVLYYFRDKLNFMRKTLPLRRLARIWVGQNALLAMSVGVRNWHYIDVYGLALGRVYIAFVLLLMLFGLFTLWRKIDHKLSLSYLFQTNGMALWLTLLLFGAVNWTNLITRYNLATQTAEKIDWDYLDRGMDYRNTFLLLRHPHTPPRLKNSRKRLSYLRYTDWRSWNYPDWRNARALRGANAGAEVGVQVQPVTRPQSVPSLSPSSPEE